MHRPVPSRLGTNKARLFLGADFPMAMDATPRSQVECQS